MRGGDDERSRWISKARGLLLVQWLVEVVASAVLSSDRALYRTYSSTGTSAAVVDRPLSLGFQGVR